MPCEGGACAIRVTCPSSDSEGWEILWRKVDDVGQPRWRGKMGFGLSGREFVDGLLEGERVKQLVPV
jgi:hypothetical protein